MRSLLPATAVALTLLAARSATAAPRPAAASPAESAPGAATASDGAPGGSPAAGASEIRSVRRMLVAWRDGWEHRDLEAFGATIGSAYRSGDLDREGLLAQKKAAFAKATKITVGMEDIAITVEGERARVVFVQKYASDRHADRGLKTLELEKESGRWVIVSESFEPSR